MAKKNLTATRDSRLSRRDWIEAAIEMLVKSSVESVRVVPLARRLKVTKGSFYWHFANRPALLRAIVDYWAQETTLDVIARLNETQISAPDRLLALLNLPFESTKAARAGNIELAIRAWARRAPEVRQTVERIDKIRLEYYLRLFAQVGFNARESEARAHLAYAFQTYAGRRLMRSSRHRNAVVTQVRDRLLSR